MPPSASRLFVVLLATAVGAVALACDPLPDECELDDNVCDGNVANRCYRPGPESRLVTTREDCGPARTCVVANAKGMGYEGADVLCAQKDVPSCPKVGASKCEGLTRLSCQAIDVTRSTWVPYACAKGCADDGGGAACVY